jgi:processive 1,2-diacylglycerol beta-glucosyltransferase
MSARRAEPATTTETARRVLVLTSSTGGGHDMRARAFANWSGEPGMPPLRVEVFQTLESGSGLYRFGVGLYNWIQRRAPRLHHLYFNFLEVAELHRRAESLAGTEAFVEKLRTFRPHALLSTHAHLNHGYFALARSLMGPALRRLTYCGELHGGYGFSRHWVNPRCEGFIGAVEETCAEAARLGMPPERNHLGGFLLKPRFWDAPAEPAERLAFVRDELGLDPARFILLLATGANSAHNHLQLLEALAAAPLRVQVVALCGRDSRAREAIRSWAGAHGNWPVAALPYFERMPLLLRSVSAVLARPGTGTTSEAILAGCPILFNGIGGIMPQERITVAFARRRGFGALVDRPGELPGVLRPLVEDPAKLRAQRLAMAAARPRAHPGAILRRVHGAAESVPAS